MTCFFVSDLHGRSEHYEKLFQAITAERPHAVFLGGDLFAHCWLSLSPPGKTSAEFTSDLLTAKFAGLKKTLKRAYPRVFLILGNDDIRSEEPAILAGSESGLWQYVHNRRAMLSKFPVFGYAHVPPTPFRLKDWERYDVSRYVDPGCLSPEEGIHSVPISEFDLRHATMKADLENLVGKDDLSNAIFLFHSPPYRTNLDRAALDGKCVDYAPLDVNVGSVAVRRFIEEHQPLLTLHGHVHESARITGQWKDKIGRTYIYSAAHDGPELALVRFRLDDLEGSTRQLL